MVFDEEEDFFVHIIYEDMEAYLIATHRVCEGFRYKVLMTNTGRIIYNNECWFSLGYGDVIKELTDESKKQELLNLLKNKKDV